MRCRPDLLASATFALALAGCGAQVPAPSLAPRAVEHQSIEMPLTSPVEPDTPADPALAARIATILAAAEAGDAAFAAQRARTEAAVAHGRGAAQGSEEWVAAEEALSALDTLRGAVRDAAAEAEVLRDDPASAATGNRAAIDRAAARLTGMEEAEGAALAALTARLG